MWKIAGYQLRDALRSRWVLGYTLVFLLLTDALFRFGGDGERVVISLLNVVLAFVPLVTIVLGSMVLYSQREYIELLLAQPLERRTLFGGLFIGLAAPAAGALLVGVGLPFVYHGALRGPHAAALGVLLLGGVLLTVVFIALSFAIALRTEERIRGLGIALAVWLCCAVLYNGLILLVIRLFAQYPLELPVIVLALLNPIDLGRILLLLNLDAAALLGFTGAVFARFAGSASGQALIVAALLAWIAVPFWIGRRTFLRKDF